MKTNRVCYIFLFLVILNLFCQNLQAKGKNNIYNSFLNPESCYRPFVRWWWNGDRVQADELVRELHLLKEAGVGGVEINPISFPPGADTMDTKALTWLSNEWIDMLKVVFKEAEKLDITCDLIIGSGWPFGSEDLSRKQRACTILTYTIGFDGGKPFEMSEFNIFKMLDPKVTIVNQARNPKLMSLFVVPDPISDLSEVIDVSNRLKDGILYINLPKGKYQLYAMVMYESFACVINGAPGAAGSILNHMDKEAVDWYLNRMSNAIEPKTGPLASHLRAFFVDSMELEGCNWTADFDKEFLKRRGYDLMPWLPFTMFKVGRLGDSESFEYGAKKSDEFQEKVNRVRFDFELTKAELLHERYTETFLAWCKKKGVKSRAQAYGRGFFPLESSLGYDIPEGESWTTNWLKHKLGEEMPDDDYRKGRGYTMINKYVSSAAHLTGKRLVSAEEMTNTYLVFNTSLELLKLGSDMSVFSGTTHSVWHGFNYSPRDAAFPGWVQYGSYYNEKNTWWPYFKYLNTYRARISSILQNADMYTDIAILPANYDMWTQIGVQTEPFPVRLNIPYTSLIWEAIHKNGGGADYISDIILQNSSVKGGKLCYGTKKYSNIFLVEVEGLTQGAMNKLEAFVKSGGTVFCIGKYPEKSLGLKDFHIRDSLIQESVRKLKLFSDNFILLKKPSDGKYLEWYKQIMDEYSLPHAVTISNPDRFLLQNRYVTDNNEDIFFFVNASISESKKTELLFPKYVISGKEAWLYDPTDGCKYRLPIKNGKINFEFGPSESYLFIFNHDKSKAPEWKRLPQCGKDSVFVHNWKLSLHHSVENWIKEMEMTELKDIKETEYLNFMGDITYKTSIIISGKSIPRYINLGKVSEICELKVNGNSVGIRWFGEKIFDISSFLKEGENTIEVKVTTLMGNYMNSLKDNKVAMRFVIKRKQPLKSMGLIGPVKLYR
jgi:hypothetical protein